MLPYQTVTTFGGDQFPIRHFLQEQPLLLCFMRASWWPYCRSQLLMLNGMADTFRETGCEIVVTSRETAEALSFETDKLVLVSDLTNEFSRQLGVTYYDTRDITRIYQNICII